MLSEMLAKSRVNDGSRYWTDWSHALNASICWARLDAADCKSKKKVLAKRQNPPPPGVRLCALEIQLIRIDLYCRPLRSQDRTTAEARALSARGTSPVSQCSRPDVHKRASGGLKSVLASGGLFLHLPRSRDLVSTGDDNLVSQHSPGRGCSFGTRHSELDGTLDGHRLSRLLGPEHSTGSRGSSSFVSRQRGCLSIPS